MTRYLHFWGVRGSYAAPFATHLKVGGNTSCVEINVDGHCLICDAGTGIIPFGEEAMTKNQTKELLVVLTHYHWDHICGLPFFVPAFTPEWKIRFFGPGETEAEIRQNIGSQMQAPYFPVGTETWAANISYIDPAITHIPYGPFSISRYGVHHPGLTYGYRIDTGGKSIVYVSDNECQFFDKSIKRDWPKFSEEEKAMFQEMNREEYEIELRGVRDADILIHDAQYSPEDYQTKRGWGHSCYTDVVNMAIDAGVKSLYMYHHDPNHNDDEIEAFHEESLKIIQQRGASLQCHVAREGLIVPLD